MIVNIAGDNENTLIYPLEQPSFDAVAAEASSINSFVSATKGTPLETLNQNPPKQAFVEDMQQSRIEQIFKRREELSRQAATMVAPPSQTLPTEAPMQSEGHSLASSDEEAKKFRDDMTGANGVLGPYRQKIIEMNGGKEDEFTDEQAFALMWRMELADVVGEVSFSEAETWQDLAATVFIPGRENVPTIAMAKAIGFIESAEDVALASADPGQLLEKMHSTISALAPNDRAKMLMQVTEYLKGVDNALVRQAIMSKLFQGDFDPTVENIFNAMDIAEVAVLSKAVTGLVKGAYSSGRLINMLKNTPTPNGAKVVFDKAKRPTDPSVTPAEVGDALNPVIHGKMGADLTGSSSDSASKIVSMLDLQDAYIARYNEVSRREGVLTPEREAELKAEVLSEIRSRKYVSNANLTNVPGGFKITYTAYEPVPSKAPKVAVEAESPSAPPPKGMDIFEQTGEYVFDIQHEGSKVGSVTGRITGDKITIESTRIEEGTRGKGKGVESYAALADWATTLGKPLVSDSVVSEDAARVYDALKRRGYDVVKSPNATSREEDGKRALVTRKEGDNTSQKEPVFTVQPKKPSQPKPQMKATQKEETFYFNVDDQGRIDTDIDANYQSTWLSADPNSKLIGNALTNYVKNAEHINREQAQLHVALFNMLKAGYSGLNKRNVARIDKVVIEGAKEGKEYSYKELKAKGLSDAEVKGYFAQRNVMFHLWKMENENILTVYRADGTKLVNTADTGQVPSRVYDDAESAREAFLRDDPDTFSVLVLDDGLVGKKKGSLLGFERAGELSKETLEDAYARGFKLVNTRNKDGRFTFGGPTGSKTNWALVKGDNVHLPDRQVVLNRIPGYMPKARSDSFYFIKTNRMTDATNPRRIEGKTKEREVTVAWADNLADAEKEAAKLSEETGNKHFVKFDREMTVSDREADVTRVKGGLFTGGRKTEDLRYVGSNSVFSFEEPMDMLQRYIGHISKQLPSNAWRMGNEARLLRLANEMMPQERLVNINQILPRAEEHFTKGSKEYDYLKQMVDQIYNISGIPSADEVARAKRMERFGSFLENWKTTKWASKYFYRSAQNKLNIEDKIRGVTFTHLLGLYNPAQVLVQASGAFAAFAINPVAGIKAIPKAIGWQILDGLARDPLAQRAAADWMRANGLGEMADGYELWSRSGFREAVEHADTNFAALTGKKPYDANVLQSLLANSSVFYQMGELVTSRYAMATALEWYKKAKGGIFSVNDKEAMKEITSRAEIYKLNMGKANPNWFNTGWRAIPFQFQQVTSKYLEKVMPAMFGGTNELTGWEKARLAFIPMTAFGAGTLPGLTYMAEMLMNMAGDDTTSLSPDEVRLYQSGALGWTLSKAAGLDVDFSSRMALGQDVFKSMIEMAMQGGSESLAALAGPSGQVGARYTQSAQYLFKSFDLVNEPDVATTDQLTIMGKVIADTLTGIPSSTRGLKDWLPLILGTSDRYVRDGKYLWEFDDMNSQTAFLAAFGFQPNEVVDVYDLINRTRVADGNTKPNSLAIIKSDADVITRLIATGILGETVEEKARIHNLIVTSVFQNYPSADVATLLDNVVDNMYTPKYIFNDLYAKFRDDSLLGVGAGLNFLNEKMAKRAEEERSDIQRRENNE